MKNNIFTYFWLFCVFLFVLIGCTNPVDTESSLLEKSKIYNQKGLHARQSGEMNEAVTLFQKAAEIENPNAQYNLGTMYQFGHGVPQNYGEAAKWFKKAAANGLPGAQYSLGYLYYYGKGVFRENIKAIEWFRKAADQNNADAQFKLAQMLQYDIGVHKDLVQAKKWYKRAADLGHEEAKGIYLLMK